MHYQFPLCASNGCRSYALIQRFLFISSPRLERWPIITERISSLRWSNHTNLNLYWEDHSHIFYICELSWKWESKHRRWVADTYLHTAVFLSFSDWAFRLPFVYYSRNYRMLLSKHSMSIKNFFLIFWSFWSCCKSQWTCSSFCLDSYYSVAIHMQHLILLFFFKHNCKFF